MTWQQQLTELHEQWYKANRPAVHADGLTPPPPKFNVKKTNDLQSCIILWINYSGGAASRRSTTGVPRVIGGKTILVKAKRGAADIDATFRGITIKIEVKNAETRDTLKLDQWKEGQKVIKAGGLWFIATGIDMFVEWFGRVADAMNRGDFPLWYPQPYDAETIDYKLYPLVDGKGLCISLQPLYPRPGGDPDMLPTLDEWRREQPKRAAADKPPPSTGDIIRAWIAPAPAFVKHTGDNCRSPTELQQAMRALQAQGFKVAFRTCLYYIAKPEEKVLKRLPKGYTCVDTPIAGLQGMEFQKRVYDRSGAEALDITPVTEISRRTGFTAVVGYKRRVEVREQFCIPEFIAGVPHRDAQDNELPANHPSPATRGEVYVIDCKRDTNDFKIRRYVQILSFILAAKGDTRKVKGGVIQWPGERVESMYRVFKV